MALSDRERLDKVLEALKLPRGQWCLSGSSVMELHGIDRERPMGDIDIFVSTALWFQLYESTALIWGLSIPDSADTAERCDPPFLYVELLGIEINVYYDWHHEAVNVAFWIHNAEMVEGWPCIPLQFLVDWKKSLGRAKDVTDAAAIEAWMEGRK